MNTERLMNITKARIEQAFQDKEVLKNEVEKNILIGDLQITVNAQNFLKENNINLDKLLERHKNCDFGTLDADDIKNNERSILLKRNYAMSQYVRIGGNANNMKDCISIYTYFDKDSKNKTIVMTPYDR